MENFNLPPDRRHPRHHAANNLLAAAIDARMFHESEQDDVKLFNALCPPAKDGSRKFSPPMLKRLKKTGIDKTNPEDLTPESAAASPPGHRSGFHYLAARGSTPTTAFLREIEVGLARKKRARPAARASTSPWPARSWPFWRWTTDWRTCAIAWAGS